MADEKTPHTWYEMHDHGAGFSHSHCECQDGNRNMHAKGDSHEGVRDIRVEELQWQRR